MKKELDKPNALAYLLAVNQPQPMRTKAQIAKDIAAAIMTSDSTDHSRALSGAEWLQQLATELVEVIKAEQFKPLADAFDEQESPGDGWRWLDRDELPRVGDYVKSGIGWIRVEIPNVWLHNGRRMASLKFRRRI